MQVHVKDEARFPGKWAFFGFDTDVPAKQVPKEASCYSWPRTARRGRYDVCAVLSHAD